MHRNRITMQLADIVIAATALNPAIPLLTTNAKHFTPVSNLESLGPEGSAQVSMVNLPDEFT